MKNKTPENVIHKKIKPYPIKVTMQNSAKENETFESQIIRLTTAGFQLNLGQTRLLIGESYQVHFQIPLYDTVIKESVKVIKTYTTFKDNQIGEKIYLAELHFLQLDPKSKMDIDRFEKAIKQK